MRRQALYFTAPHQVEVRDEQLSDPAPGELLVRTLVSGISSGTELLYYRGQVPDGLALDAGIAALAGSARYPFQYGYSCVGEVVDVGPGADRAWLGQRVFAFNPHSSHFWAAPAALMPLPAGMPPDRAVFLPNMETAVNFVMDARPMVGEFGVVFGLGVVGLLTAALLSQFPLGGLVGVDRFALRRAQASRLGVGYVLDPADEAGWAAVLAHLCAAGLKDGLDLALELSGAPAALDQALGWLGFGGRLVIGSWYGTKLVPLNLGGAFHRSRIELISSQVTTIAPGLSGRWDKPRRFSAAWAQLARIQPEGWISQRFQIDHAAEAYRILDEDAAALLQVVFDYQG